MTHTNSVRSLLVGLALLGALGPGSPLAAQEGSPIQLALFPPVQLVGEGESVRGIRLSLLFGRNANVTGLDWSFIANHTTGDQVGVQFGIGALVEGDFAGWQANGISIVRGELHGLQTGFVNVTGSARGVGWGAVNYSKGNFRGLQLGLVNYAQSMNGGFQVGLLNIISEGGQFPIFPIVNWGK